jgi:hypothetical protein
MSPNTPSPAPGVAQTADKAKMAAAVSGLITMVLLLAVFFYDEKNGTNLAELLLVVLGGGGAAGATGVATYKKRNKAA